MTLGEFRAALLATLKAGPGEPIRGLPAIAGHDTRVATLVVRAIDPAGTVVAPPPWRALPPC